MSTAADAIVRFRCECGAVLSARANLVGRKGKCKSCGRVRDIPAESENLGGDEQGAIGIQEICSVCQTVIEDDDLRTTCDDCKLPFHDECWQENLGCSAYGCASVNKLKQGPDIRVGPLTNAALGTPAVSSAPLRARQRFGPPPPAEDNDVPWDHLLLAASAIAVLVGFVTCGVPTLLLAGLAVWRIAVNKRKADPIVLPVLALCMCSVGLLLGLCLSAAFWVEPQ